MERCLKKLVLEAKTTGFQDPARTARSPQREELCWKGSVGGQWLYTHECRPAVCPGMELRGSLPYCSDRGALAGYASYKCFFNHCKVSFHISDV